MKIMQIAPGSFSEEEIRMRQVYAESLCSPGTRVTVVPIEGPASATDAATMRLMSPGILKRVEQAEREKYDAVVIACYGDPGLEEAKTIATIPVVGAAEAAYHIACLLADRFGLVTVISEFIPFFVRQVRTYGVADRIVSMKEVSIPVLELRSRRDELEKMFTEKAKEAIEEGAQLIIPACLAILPTLGVGSAKRLSDKLGIKILDATANALRVAELLVGLSISQSKLAFPKSKSGVSACKF